GRLELRNEPLRELRTFPYQGLFRTLFKHFRRTAQPLMDLGIKLPQHLALDDPNLLDRIIHLEQIVARKTERLQENGRRHFSPAIDAHIENIARIELEVEPRSAIGNDPGGIQDLAAGMGPALIVRERCAGRAMQLAHHHTLRAVDDERPAFRHERQLTDIDFLFSDVEHFFLGAFVFLVEDDQAHPEFQRNGKGHPLLKAFSLVVLGSAERVARKLQYGGIVVIRNRKNACQSGLKPMILATLRFDLPLKKFFIGALLNLDKIRNLYAAMNARVVFPFDELL